MHSSWPLFRCRDMVHRFVFRISQPIWAAGGPRKRRAVKLEGDSRVFAEGALPQAPGGGGLTTYRELCGAFIVLQELISDSSSCSACVPNHIFCQVLEASHLSVYMCISQQLGKVVSCRAKERCALSCSRLQQHSTRQTAGNEGTAAPPHMSPPVPQSQGWQTTWGSRTWCTASWIWRTTPQR